MADISKITPPGSQTTYNLKDATAREQANWNTNNGVKNFATENSFSNTGYYKDVPVDGSLTGEIEVYIGNITSTDTDSSKCAILYIYSDGTSSASYLVDRGTSTTLYGNLENNVLKSIRIYPSDNYVHSSGDTVTVTNLMVSPKSIYDADSTYEPYALPNTKITPELIDLVDSGAKNLLQNHGVSKTANNVTFTVNNDGSVTVSTNGAASASTSLLMTSGGYIPNDFKDCIYSGAPSGTDNGICLYIGYSNSGSSEARSQRIYNGAAEVVRGDYPYLYCSIYIESGKTISTPITFKPMICTKAAWDVSQKYVPYRPTYEETVEQVAENKNNILSSYDTTAFACSAANTYEYTGISITCPANKLIEIWVVDEKGSAMPSGILICDSNSDITTAGSVIAENSEQFTVSDNAVWARELHCIPPRIRNTDKTFYVWVKRTSTASNNIHVITRAIVTA